ncbi:hypothetical protein Y032_0389g516 [Ancylostoma ceylanicum]|uniref:Uncharacterized protein n=1 Tax=Ancylostoma ceylanicum TaxID=53326 RepID=A0A016RSE0_9BILA|nr:hypothetical protein Y032_0389g516 [Ancylostoma ceylanicum]
MTPYGTRELLPKTITQMAITKLNEGRDKFHRTNCLIFFSARNSSSGLITLNPTKNVNLKVVVAVSLRGIDLSGMIVAPKGVAVNASLGFTEEDLNAIVRSVLSAF